MTATADRPTTEAIARARSTVPVRRARRSWSDVALGVWGLIVLLFLFTPIIVIVVYSFNTGRLLTSWQGFGFDAYAAGLDRPVIRGAIATSLQAAVGAALLSAVIGSLAGLALARRGGRWAGLLTLLPPGGGAPRYAVLTALDERQAVVETAGQRHLLTLAALAQVWRGDFATFWRTPPGWRPGAEPSAEPSASVQ